MKEPEKDDSVSLPGTPSGAVAADASSVGEMGFSCELSDAGGADIMVNREAGGDGGGDNVMIERSTKGME